MRHESSMGNEGMNSVAGSYSERHTCHEKEARSSLHEGQETKGACNSAKLLVSARKYNLLYYCKSMPVHPVIVIQGRST